MQTSRGYSLVEVLIALLISAFGMLGVLAIQARAASIQKDSIDRKVATELTLQFAERVRANQAGFIANSYQGDLDITAATPALAACAAAHCTSAEVAARDLSAWFIDLRHRLPGAGAYVRQLSGNTDEIAVTVAWREVRATNQDLAGGTNSTAVADPACAEVGVTDPAYRCFAARIFP